jgi:hypothetical protein
MEECFAYAKRKHYSCPALADTCPKQLEKEMVSWQCKDSFRKIKIKLWFL